MEYEEGQLVAIDLVKSNHPEKLYFTAFSSEYNKGTEVMMCRIISSKGMGYKVKSIVTQQEQVVHPNCIESRCRKCKSKKLYSQDRKKQICPFCDEI